MCRLTGRIYHTISNSNNNKHKGISHGLIRSQVAVALAERIEVLEENDDDGESISSELGIRLDDGTLIPIRMLPADAEPGPWAMPADLE